MNTKFVIDKIIELSNKRNRLIIAIDGRCASGKTTLAEAIRSSIDCNVIHMDDFFLQAQQRTSERLQLPGGNVDYERVESEVLLPASKGMPFTYNVYDCKSQSFIEQRTLDAKKILIVEGSYSCNPELVAYYDYRIYMTVDEKEQIKRIADRGGDIEVFLRKWIPLEEFYFKMCNVKENCQITLDTTGY